MNDRRGRSLTDLKWYSTYRVVCHRIQNGWKIAGYTASEGRYAPPFPCFRVLLDSLNTLEEHQTGRYSFCCEERRRFWHLDIRMFGASAICACEPVCRENVFRSSQEFALRANFRRTSSLMAVKVSGQFYVESLEEDLQSLLHLEAGSDLTACMEHGSGRVEGTVPLEFCLEQMFPVQYYDIFHAASRDIFLAITLVPIRHPGKAPRVLCSLQSLTAEDFWQRQRIRRGTAEELFSSLDVQRGVREINGSLVEYVLCGNHLISGSSEGVRTRVCSRMLHRVLREQRVVTEQVNVPGERGMLHLRCVAIPVAEQKQVWLILTREEEPEESENTMDFSPRELLVAQMVLRGAKNEAIARNMGLSTSTVKKTLSNIYARTQVCGRTELANRMSGLGLCLSEEATDAEGLRP